MLCLVIPRVSDLSSVYTVEQLAQLLDAEYIGSGGHVITGLASLERAKNDEVAFLSDLKYKSQLHITGAGCVLLGNAPPHGSVKTNVILVEDPYLAYAKTAKLFDTKSTPDKGVHASATLGKNVVIADDVSVAAGCVIGDGVVIEGGVIIGANCTIGDSVKIGVNTRVYPNVSIYHEVEIGKNCIIQSGAVLGSDGFGYANDKGIWVRIPQNGRVKIGSDVDIGANTCIDRGALNDTLVGDGVKIDNLCHIAHNVEIGGHTAMAGFTGIAGSAKVGKFCTFSGRASILGHLTIADGTHVTACSLINRSNKEAGVFSSGTGMQENKSWRKNVARFRQLDDIAKNLKKLQKEFEKMKDGLS